jgi:hypothetical protein
MQSFELQVYKGGKWEFDSYFSDREIAMMEAKRMSESPRHKGVRVLMENYNEDTNKANCDVIFSRLKRGSDDEWRSQVKQEARVAQRAEGAPERPRRSAGSRKKSNGGFYALIAMALLIALGGIAAMIGLQEIALP